MNQVPIQDSQVGNPVENLAERPVEKTNVADVARGAKLASRRLASVPGPRRNAALSAAADAIEARKSEILAANRRDCDDASRAVEAGVLGGQGSFRKSPQPQGVGQGFDGL